MNPSVVQSIAFFGNDLLTSPLPFTRFSSLRKLRLEKCPNVSAKLMAEVFASPGALPNLEKVNFSGSFVATKEDAQLIERSVPKFVDVLAGLTS